jgi:hypothetical protein
MTGLSALKIFVALTAIGLYAADLHAARATDVIARNATPVVQLAQGDDYRRDDYAATARYAPTAIIIPAGTVRVAIGTAAACLGSATISSDDAHGPSLIRCRC